MVYMVHEGLWDGQRERGCTYVVHRRLQKQRAVWLGTVRRICIVCVGLYEGQRVVPLELLLMFSASQYVYLILKGINYLHIEQTDLSHLLQRWNRPPVVVHLLHTTLEPQQLLRLPLL